MGEQSTTNEPIIEQIRRLATERGWGPQLLAERAEVSYGTAWTVLRGKGDTTTRKADAMLFALRHR